MRTAGLRRLWRSSAPGSRRAPGKICGESTIPGSSSQAGRGPLEPFAKVRILPPEPRRRRLLAGLRPPSPWVEATDPAHCRSAVSLRPAVLVRGDDPPEPPVRHSPLAVLSAALHPSMGGAVDVAWWPSADFAVGRGD